MAEKKVLENPILAGMVVPLAVVLVAALLIFGVSKLLTPERNHTELVRELKAKRFGNRWIAAYELSKLIAASRIPPADEPALIDDLTELYESSKDPRTKKFLVMAASALKNPKKIDLIAKATQDPIRDIKFHAIVALANVDKGLKPNLDSLKEIIKNPEQDDHGLLQASILGLTHHVTPEANKDIRKFLDHPNFKVQMAAASGLINYRDELARNKISKILLGTPEFFADNGINQEEVKAVEVNMLAAIGKASWKGLRPLVAKVRKQDNDIKVHAKAAEILDLFKM